MVGTVCDYNERYIQILSGEKRKIMFFKSDEDYQKCLEDGMRIDSQVIFDNQTNEIKKFF